MGRILPCVIFLFGFISESKSFAQITNEQNAHCLDSSIHIEGYFVRVYKKKDINDKERNRIARINNKPFILNIDGIKYDEFFFSVDSTSIEPALANLLLKNKKDIYLRCSNTNFAIFKEQFCAEEYLQKDTCRSFESNEYYSLESNSKYCYQIFYASGIWLKAMADNNSTKWRFLKQFEYIDASVKTFNVYLLYKMDNYMPEKMEFRKLHLWKKVSSLWSN
jgi:hypothetical protein